MADPHTPMICDACGDEIPIGDAVWVCPGCDATYCNPCAADLGDNSPECPECAWTLEVQSNE